EVLDGAFTGDPHVVGWTLEDLSDRAQPQTRAGLDRQPHDLVVVVASLTECTARIVGDFEIPASEQVGHGAVVDAPQLHDQAWVPRTAPFHLALETLEDQCGTGAESVIEICQGNHLDSAVGAVGPGDLADADQEGVPPPGSLRSRGPEWPPSDGLARSTNTR